MSELRVGKAVVLAGMTLIPIERVQLDRAGGSGGVWFHATKDPVALVIRGPEGTRALDVCARSLELDALAAAVPGLAAALER